MKYYLVKLLSHEVDGLKVVFLRRTATYSMMQRFNNFAKLTSATLEYFDNGSEYYNLLRSVSDGAKVLVNIIFMNKGDEGLKNLQKAYFTYAYFAINFISSTLPQVEDNDVMSFMDFIQKYLNLDDEKKNIVKTMLMNEQKGGDDDDAD